jgi:hypothetical protein
MVMTITKTFNGLFEVRFDEEGENWTEQVE